MYQLRILGGAVVEDDRGPVRELAERRHSLALLAILATAPGHTASRGKLVGLLWPGAPDRAGRNRLNTCLHHVRTALGEDVIVSSGDDLRLDPDRLASDLDEFRAALERGERERAVTLCRGRLLDGFALRGSPEFDRWLDSERDRVRRAYREALEMLAEEAEERGDPTSAARWWRLRVNDDRYDSRIAGRLMEALVEAGNPAAALEVGEVHGRLLREELDLAANAGIAELMERLRNADRPTARGGTSEKEDPCDVEEPSSAAGAPSRSAGPDPRRLPVGRGSSTPVTSRLAFAGLGAVGLLGAVIALWHVLGAGAAAPLDPPAGGAGSVAVLPFETIGETEPNAFARGVHLGVLTHLSNIPELAVLSEQSVERLGTLEQPAKTAAARFGVDWIVRGSVQRAGNLVRVHVRLEDARRDRQVWTHTRDAALAAEELFEAQGEIASGIARALRVRLSPRTEARLASVPTRNTAAYELYLQAGELSRSGPADERVIDAQIELYRRALELDSTFAPAWAMLARGFVGRGFGGGPNRHHWVDSARWAAGRALELDPGLADAYASLGSSRWIAGDVDGVIAALERALELQPNHRVASHNLAVILTRQGRIAEALRWWERAHRLSPTERSHLLALAGTNELLGRRAQADAWLALARERGHATLRFEAVRDLVYGGRPDRARSAIEALPAEGGDVTARRLRAALALYERDWPEARRLYRSLYPGHPYAFSPVYLGLLWDELGLAWALQRLDGDEEAREIAGAVIRRAHEELGPEAPAFSGYLRHRLAVAHLILGDTATALDELERLGDGNLEYLPNLETVPVLDPLRDHPRFRALLAGLRDRLAEERGRVDREGWGLPLVAGP